MCEHFTVFPDSSATVEGTMATVVTVGGGENSPHDNMEMQPLANGTNDIEEKEEEPVIPVVPPIVGRRSLEVMTLHQVSIELYDFSK